MRKHAIEEMVNMVQLALYQPDIAPNVGTIIRLCACMDTPLHIIEPCGFPWDERKIKRAAMDYVDHITLTKHANWESFTETTNDSRIILLSTKASTSYTDFAFEKNDILLMGRESAGVPELVHNQSDAQIIIPMHSKMRSLNVAIASAMVLGEALRQISGFHAST